MECKHKKEKKRTACEFKQFTLLVRLKPVKIFDKKAHFLHIRNKVKIWCTAISHILYGLEFFFIASRDYWMHVRN